MSSDRRGPNHQTAEGMLAYSSNQAPGFKSLGISPLMGTRRDPAPKRRYLAALAAREAENAEQS